MCKALLQALVCVAVLAQGAPFAAGCPADTICHSSLCEARSTLHFQPTGPKHFATLLCSQLRYPAHYFNSLDPRWSLNILSKLPVDNRLTVAAMVNEWSIEILVFVCFHDPPQLQ